MKKFTISYGIYYKTKYLFTMKIKNYYLNFIKSYLNLKKLKFKISNLAKKLKNLKHLSNLN